MNSYTVDFIKSLPVRKLQTIQNLLNIRVLRNGSTYDNPKDGDRRTRKDLEYSIILYSNTFKIGRHKLEKLLGR